MLSSTTRLTERHIRARQGYHLYQAPPLALQCFTSSDLYLQHRAYSSKSGASSQVASSSKPPPMTTKAFAHTRNKGPTVDSWSLRKRLRKLSLEIGPSSQLATSSEDGAKIAKKNWKHPSRALAAKGVLRERAEKRWTKDTISAAEKNAVAGRNELLKKQADTTRAQANVQKKLTQDKRKIEENSWDGILATLDARNTDEADIGLEANKGIGFHSAMSGKGSSSGSDSMWGDDFAEKFFQRPQVKEQEAILENVNESTKEDKDYSDRDGAPHLKLKNEEEMSERPNRFANDIRTELIKGASLAYHRHVVPVKDLKEVRVTTNSNYLPLQQIPNQSDERRVWWDQEGKWSWTVGGTLSAKEMTLQVVKPLRKMEVPQLAHGLDRVLFNPGVHWLRDVRSGIYNFEPQIRNLQDVDLFDYSALPPYQTSSKDAELAELVRRLSKRYSGSTSSMTALLSHIYFLISAWKQPDLSGFSSGFNTLPKTYSFGAKLPASIVLRRFEEQVGEDVKVRYAIDADKTSEGSSNNNYVLMNLGKSVEKLLTSSMEDYNKYLRLNSHVLSQEEKEKKEAYHYASTDKILMRSQLDCYDERLPRKSFDLKTRAVIAIRQDRANWAESSGYMIRHQTGTFESFEREMWDMTRATLLKYYFQARIGNMDGIMVAYHSTSTVYGFQYLPCEDMALKLFSSVEMGEQAFKLSVGFLERLLDTMTDIQPDHSLKITLDTELRENPKMFAFVQAIDDTVAEQDIEELDESMKETQLDTGLEEGDVESTTVFADSQEAEEGQAVKIEETSNADRQRQILQLDVQVDRYLGDELVKGPVDFTVPSGYRINEAMEDEISRRKRAALPLLDWSIEYSITPRSDLAQRQVKENLQKIISRKEKLAPLILPNLEALNERERLREDELSKDQVVLQKFYEDRRSGLAMGMPIAPGQVQSEEAKVSTVDVKDGEAAALTASTDLKEAKERPQQWKKRTSSIERLRELARLGKEDKDKDALTDKKEVYERRGD